MNTEENNRETPETTAMGNACVSLASGLVPVILISSWLRSRFDHGSAWVPTEAGWYRGVIDGNACWYNWLRHFFTEGIPIIHPAGTKWYVVLFWVGVIAFALQIINFAITFSGFLRRRKI